MVKHILQQAGTTHYFSRFFAPTGQFPDPLCFVAAHGAQLDSFWHFSSLLFVEKKSTFILLADQTTKCSRGIQPMERLGER
jgi:hypothetical protein